MRLSGATFDCADAGRVARFWGAVFGVEPVDQGSGWWMVEGPDGLRFEFQPVVEPTAGKARLHLDLHVDDVAVEVERLVGLGAAVAWEEEFGPEAGSYRNVVLRDPEGTEFCVGGG
jgi:predicted enzyme related to lactoylglutathione lyase